MSDAWQRLMPKLEELSHLRSAGALLSWDQAVLMPPRGAAARAGALATIESIAHERLTDPELGDLIEELASDTTLDEGQAANVRVLKRVHSKAVRLPPVLVAEIARARGVAYEAWTEARPASDFRLFQPHLERLVALKVEEADALGYEEERYDALLDLYEPGMTTRRVEALFTGLVEGLKSLVEDAIPPAVERPAWMEQPFEALQQDRLCRWLVSSIGFSFDGGRLDSSPHPFTTSIGPGDVRQTIKTQPNALLPCIYAALHETGHALYEQGIPKHLVGLPAGSAPSLGLHESQSRLWENLVGRRRSFTDFLLPHVKERFPAELGLVSPDEFHLGVNYPERTTIRIHADELTYNLHIAMRLEIELALFRNELDVADLPDAWNAGMEKHLGIRPQADGEGVLQDVHWSMGLHGYFATYTLGNIYSAAFYNKAAEELGGLDDGFHKGDVSRLLGWLREKIHSQAYLYPATELAEKVVGQPVSSDPLLGYLKEKYSSLT
ncbi:MAG: carboxypeptidase M32 [Actinomycetota bacterium]|nr:carboxypeptidase M32 [Actinomycetota bacterium]